MVDSEVKSASKVGIAPILITGALIQPAPGYSAVDALNAIVDRVDNLGPVTRVGNGPVKHARGGQSVIAFAPLEIRKRLVIVIGVGERGGATERVVARVAASYR